MVRLMMTPCCPAECGMQVVAVVLVMLVVASVVVVVGIAVQWLQPAAVMAQAVEQMPHGTVADCPGTNAGGGMGGGSWGALGGNISSHQSDPC